jgi:hypothetical protein
MATIKDPYAGQGGSYIVKNGKRERVTDPTQDHPEGNCARDADGTPVPPAHHTAKAAGDAEAPAAGGDPSLPPGGAVAAGGNNTDKRRA